VTAGGSRRDRFAVGWLLGLALAGAETIRGGVPSGNVGVSLALMTLGLYPLGLGLAALILSTPPRLRQPVHLMVALGVLAAFPWITLVIFPNLSMAAIANPSHWPRLAAVLGGTVLAAAEVGRRFRIWARACPPVPAAALLGVAALAAGGAMLSARPKDQSVPPATTASGVNVLMITLDTVREDALGSYAGEDRGTPTMDSLAASGLRIAPTISCAPWTLASISSIMTGLHPSTTGVFTGENRLAGGIRTLAESFASRGYHTHAIVTNTWLKPEFGLAQGFAVYDHRAPVKPAPELYSFTLFRLFRRWVGGQAAPPRESATDVVDQALAFLGSSPPQPFFLWLHFNDVHDPYAPPFRHLPREPGYRGSFRTTSGRIVRLREGHRISSADRLRIRALYRGEVEYLDRSLGRLCAGLRTAPVAPTMVALLADHGEEFWEHESVGHGHSLHGELLRVPFIVSYPAMVEAGSVSSRPCALVDVCPTLMHLAELPVGHTQGYAITAPDPAPERPMIAEGLEFFGERKALTMGRWKLIVDPDSGRSWLFDRATDPLEQFDVSREHSATLAALQDTLSAHLARFRADADRLSLARDASAMVLSSELREQLRAQGYLE
jgi:arylsulfatase A-like enzyme